jgi:uncharacterized protein YqgV (UPF0045/DUF77 family)
MNTISAQLSLYPLHQDDLAPAISAALEAIADHGLESSTGTMSTVINGDAETVFEALKTAFQAAAAQGDVVMVTTLSNCCPPLRR